VLELAATLGIALIAVTVGVRLAAGAVGFEAALVVLVLAPELYLPLRNLASQYHASADGRAVSQRLLDVVDAPVEDGNGSIPSPAPRAATVRLEGVCFFYAGRGGPALDGVDLELRPRETLALVGPSGAGKSTVASLLLGLGTPDRGVVRVGAVDLRSCELAAWRARLAWVPQRPTLFRGTVADNIRLGVPTADAGQVHAAAALVGADDFIRSLRDGYETVVGDGGRPLSAGQLQRLALARAFLRDAELMILDEPTANLDPSSVEVVLTALETLRGACTILVIAHEPYVAASADRVVRLEAGRIAEEALEPTW
jgi:ABC-type transport system involved in cytochrome bd biosynthesis fused ATPase/permease subunit